MTARVTLREKVTGAIIEDEFWPEATTLCGAEWEVREIFAEEYGDEYELLHVVFEPEEGLR